MIKYLSTFNSTSEVGASATANAPPPPMGYRLKETRSNELFRPVERQPDELVALYLLCGEQQEQLAVERAVDVFEDLLSSDKVAVVNDLLTRAKVERLGPSVLVGILAITKHAVEALPNRGEFLARCETQLVKSLGADRAERLLRSRR